ncbi:MAG: nucleotidyl transferase AbiEii/AbiGii toxin family protein [Ilumatobacteraceae bacterium]
MTLLAAALRRMSAALDASGHRYALVGGLAVSVRSEPRMTRDADFAVAVSDDADAERLISALRVAGFVASTLVEQVATDRLATVRLEHASNPGLFTDLLFSSSGIEREIVASAEQIDVMNGVVLPVASVGHLIAMKLLARDDRRRPNDADDLRALAQVATEGDWSAAAEAVALIETRGFNRERDLKSALSALRSDGAY